MLITADWCNFTFKKSQLSMYKMYINDIMQLLMTDLAMCTYILYDP